MCTFHCVLWFVYTATECSLVFDCVFLCSGIIHSKLWLTRTVCSAFLPRSWQLGVSYAQTVLHAWIECFHYSILFVHDCACSISFLNGIISAVLGFECPVMPIFLQSSGLALVRPKNTFKCAQNSVVVLTCSCCSISGVQFNIA